MSHFNLTSRLKKQTMLAGIQDTFSYMSKNNNNKKSNCKYLCGMTEIS